MEKIWITGAKGHVGTALSALLDCREYEIFPTDVDEVDVTVMLQAAKLILTKHLR